MNDDGEVRRVELKRLRSAIAEGDADVASGRVSVIASDDDLDALFASL